MDDHRIERSDRSTVSKPSRLETKVERGISITYPKFDFWNSVRLLICHRPRAQRNIPRVIFFRLGQFSSNMDSLRDLHKLRVRPLDYKSDYTLWCIRIRAATICKGLHDVFENTAPENEVKLTERKFQASNIAVNTISDPALRVVRSELENPEKMLVKLNARYDSKSTASKIFRMSEVVSVRYTNLRHDVAKPFQRLFGVM